MSVAVPPAGVGAAASSSMARVVELLELLERRAILAGVGVRGIRHSLGCLASALSARCRASCSSAA
eukprot:4518467-Pyramimonas_sp.AAC.1